ncbi:MAG: hypothetical protein IPG34_03975 [Rhodocyclaceae bacterium]|nr:hypothetical protein [Rhodocyclaceae bacterium]
MAFLGDMPTVNAIATTPTVVIGLDYRYPLSCWTCPSAFTDEAAASRFMKPSQYRLSVMLLRSLAQWHDGCCAQRCSCRHAHAHTIKVTTLAACQALQTQTKENP